MYSVKNIDKLFSLFVSFSLVPVTILLLVNGIAWAEPSPLHVVSTRDHFDKLGNQVISNRPYEPFNFDSVECSPETVVYVHGVWTGRGRTNDVISNSDQNILDTATEIFERVRMSLDNMGYAFPLIGFSWDSDTEISSNGWEIAKEIARDNGPKLAQFIIDLKDWCNQQDPGKDIKIRLIGHSLGSRVILSALDNLSKSNQWDDKITSVHLMGAAVDDDEVSKNPNDVSEGTIKFAYGTAIENTVFSFYNLVNPEDDVLEPGYIAYYWLGWLPIPIYSNYNYLENQPVYYPYFEQDLALGQNGIQSDILQQDRPTNYLDISDTDQEIPNFQNANGDNRCDLIDPISKICTISQIGDNHLGYAGFRDPVDGNRLEDIGAIDIIVNTWRNSP
jgi:pimeloyl-ACP methyl ester carboxylesterase